LASAFAVLTLINAFAANLQLQLNRIHAEQTKTQQVRDFLLGVFAGANLEEKRNDVTARES
jgi:hypothetical protein